MSPPRPALTSPRGGSAEAGLRATGLDHGQWRMPGPGPASIPSSDWLGSGYQHTWTCTCGRSKPAPRPSPPTAPLSSPPRPPSRLGVCHYLYLRSLPAPRQESLETKCHYWDQDGGQRMWPLADLTQHWPEPGTSPASPRPRAGLQEARAPTHSDSRTALSLSESGCGNH